MEQNTDDLPLMANTSHILVKHYSLDLNVCFESQTIEGSIVLFLEPNVSCEDSNIGKPCPSQAVDACSDQAQETHSGKSTSQSRHSTISERDGNRKQTTSENCCDRENHGSGDFRLVLDCCDLSVLKVEEVNVTGAPKKCMSSMLPSSESEQQLTHGHHIPPELVALPANRWKEQMSYYMHCSRAPGCGELRFFMETWSLQISKCGVNMATDFPSALRIWYKTTANGRSIKWTKDQSGRPCVFTFGSPINNRALFPCQEPPVAMSTWNATVRVPRDCTVLMSGENFAAPHHYTQGICSWFYYVTMPMPASTFTIAVGSWTEVKDSPYTSLESCHLFSIMPLNMDEKRSSEQECRHVEYPCRYRSIEACSQICIPHRVFAPDVLTHQCKEKLIPVLSQCLEAAYSVLGTHPFSRLDILIVPSNFSSLGMASPHIIYLSQSILSGRNQLCISRVCHEIAHAWFGLAIGARDWTEEWLSEGFATHLEDVFLAKVLKLSEEDSKEHQDLKALLRWRRLNDELSNSQEELQILRPQGESTGEVSDSGASMVRHGLNADKTFMQVHYLKGYFLLRHLANTIGADTYLAFLRSFVNRSHGQLILSQDFLLLLLETVPEHLKHGLSVDDIYQIWLDPPGMPQPLLEESQTWTGNGLVQQVKQEVSKWIQLNQKNRRGGTGRKRQHCEEFDEKIVPDQLVLLLDLLLEEKTLCAKTLQCLKKTYNLHEQDAEVRHRWCELVIKHKYTTSYKDVETFLLQDQAMGVYLYGELMVNEDARQQELAHRCFAAVRDQMDVSCVKVVGEMLF
ncbi:aminopeptidase O [Bufo gargarizans]|uniref:aminopeptidase O n=1 Tax=Bufo gargarizans TaxID=30331 RepID=UPI001CF4D351|nr:aminopeptidase O [Bufo gargarizans]XP_044129461.1 aminopeptidase O [Bufo gargarizans]